jgi:hypothetical protein
VNISDEAVEAAIIHVYGASAVDDYMPEARSLIEAIAPSLKAAAWDEGYTSGIGSPFRNHIGPNPYRSQA